MCFREHSYILWKPNQAFLCRDIGVIDVLDINNIVFTCHFIVYVFQRTFIHFVET